MILFYSFNFVPKLHCIVYNTCHSPSKTNKHNFINHAIAFPYRDGFWHHLNWSMYKDLWDCGKGNHVYEQAIAVSNITHKLLHDSVLFGGEYKLWFERCLHLNELLWQQAPVTEPITFVSFPEFMLRRWNTYVWISDTFRPYNGDGALFFLKTEKYTMKF